MKTLSAVLADPRLPGQGYFKWSKKITGKLLPSLQLNRCSLDTFLTSFPQAHDFIFSVLIFQFIGVWNCLFFKRVSCNCPRGGGGVRGGSQQSFILGHSALRSNPLTFYFPVIHVSEDIIKIQSIENKTRLLQQKVPLSYAFYCITNGTLPHFIYLA